MRFIETFKDGDRISDVYLCKSKSTALTKTGKEYENVMLADKTGQIDFQDMGCEFWWNRRL